MTLFFKLDSKRSARLFLLLLTIAVVGFAWLYVANEHTFYWWDYSGYQDSANQMAKKLRELPVAPKPIAHAAFEIWKSTVNDYNDLFKLPLMPALWLFGDSRFVFVLSLVLFYLLPFTLVIGLVAACLMPHERQLASWTAITIALLTPATWTSTLRGFPDVGAACLCTLAIWLYLDERHNSDWRKLCGSGCLLGLAVLFRRHFAYDLIAFFVAGIAQLVFAYLGNRKAGITGIKKGALRLAAVGIACLCFMLTFGFPFVYRLATTNFGLLYSSYAVPPQEGMIYFANAFGWLAWMLAATGLVLGITQNIVSKPIGVWTAVFGAYSLFQWLFFVGQQGHHYKLHFVVFIVIGLTCLWLWVRTLQNRQIQWFVGGTFATYCLLNAWAGNWAAPKVGSAGASFFAEAAPPLQRTDYSEVVRLLDSLRNASERGDTVYVAASSDVLNDDILRHAQDELYGADSKVRFLYSPHIDSRDTYPLEQWLQAQFVVLATPLQTHLHPDQQKVVSAMLTGFADNWRIAQDFRLLPGEFTLASGVKVQIWKRVSSSNIATVLETSEEVVSYVGHRPGGQRSWITLDTKPGYWILKFRNGSWHIGSEPIFGHSGAATSFLNIDPPGGRNHIEGRIQTQGCSLPELSFGALDHQGKVFASTTLRPQTERFILHLDTRSAYRLLFTVGETPPQCTVQIEDLRIGQS